MAGDFGRDIVLADVSSLALGIEVQGLRGGEPINDIIIPCNATIPDLSLPAFTLLDKKILNNDGYNLYVI